MKHRSMWLLTVLAAVALLAACNGSARPKEDTGDIDEVAPVTEATSTQEAEASTAAQQEPAEAPAEQQAAKLQSEAVAPEGETGEQDTAELPAAAPAAVAKNPAKYGLVAGSLEDRGFNQLAWEGLQRAAAELGIETLYSETEEGDDYAQHINTLLQQGANGIVTVGFNLAGTEKVASEANPNVAFIGVDFPSQTAHDLGLLFDVDEPSFLAGYLAAAMSESGVVCTYGGRQTPPVLAFIVGFENGVNYYNAQHGAAVQLLGWQTDPGSDVGGRGIFVDSFTDVDAGRRITEDFAAQGCDVIFPVAGAVGLGSAQVAQEQGLNVIGVDADQAQTNPQYAEVYLTSVLKKIDVMVFEAVQQIESGKLQTEKNFRNNVIGTLANGGVGLAPFYTFDSQIPPDVKAALATLENQLVAGAVSTGWPISKPDQQGMTTTAPEQAPGDNQFVGTYIALLPAASSPGRDITLAVNRDGTVQMSTDFLNGKPPIVEVGTWQDNGDGTMTVALTGRTDGATYNQPDVITLSLQGSELMAIAWNRNVYGSEGLTLAKQ